MDKVIVFHRPDGGVSVAHPIESAVATLILEGGAYTNEVVPQLVYPGRKAPETEAEYYERWVQRFIDDGLAADIPVIIDVANIPQNGQLQDRRFREAWTFDGVKVDVDMSKAKVIHMDRIRKERNAELDRLDKDYAREEGRGNAVAKNAVEAKRETLRNIPQSFDLSVASTADELDALWPVEVPR